MYYTKQIDNGMTLFKYDNEQTYFYANVYTTTPIYGLLFFNTASSTIQLFCYVDEEGDIDPNTIIETRQVINEQYIGLFGSGRFFDGHRYDSPAIISPLTLSQIVDYGVPYIDEVHTIEECWEWVRTHVDDDVDFDLDVYTNGLTNPLITLLWSNLRNPKENTDYYIKIQISKDLLETDWADIIDGTPFDTASATISYADAKEIGFEIVNREGKRYITLRAILFHYDDRGFQIVDSSKNAYVFEGGEISGEEIEKHENQPVTDNDKYDEKNNTYIDEHRGSELSLDNVMTSSYKMSLTNLRLLKNFMWSADYIDNYYLINNNPIENIISIKTLPFDVETEPLTTIKVGNVVITGVQGYPVNASHVYDSLPAVRVPKKYNNFLDYVKTSVSVYLPFIGVHDLPTNLVMGRYLKFKYIYDVVTGACAVEIKVGDTTEKMNVLDYVMGNCAIDLPISAQNRSQVEIAQQKTRNSGIANAISGTAGVLGSIGNGNIFGAISGTAQTVANAMNSYLDYASAEYHTTTKGTIGNQLINFIPNNCFLIIDRPYYEEPKTYGKDMGYPWELSATLGTLKGYTEVTHAVELSGIPCTFKEREELRSLLIGGVYL